MSYAAFAVFVIVVAWAATLWHDHHHLRRPR